MREEVEQNDTKNCVKISMGQVKRQMTARLRFPHIVHKKSSSIGAEQLLIPSCGKATLTLYHHSEGLNRDKLSS